MGQNGGQKGQNVPISRKNVHYELENCNYTLNHVGKLTVTQIWYKASLMDQFRGQDGGQKGQNVLISRKNEYYELEICNNPLNHIGKLTVTQT